MLNLHTDLFTLAKNQLDQELEGGKINDYSDLDILDRAILIRAELDEIKNRDGKVRNIHTGRLRVLYTDKELRRLKYLTTGK